MSGVHAAIGPLITAALILLAVAALASLRISRLVASVDVARRAALLILVAQAAIGAALAVRGREPTEAIHWLYGGAIVVALMVPDMLPDDVADGRRATTLAVASVFSVLMAWRLGASG